MKTCKSNIYFILIILLVLSLITITQGCKKKEQTTKTDSPETSLQQTESDVSEDTTEMQFDDNLTIQSEEPNNIYDISSEDSNEFFYDSTDEPEEEHTEEEVEQL